MYNISKIMDVNNVDYGSIFCNTNNLVNGYMVYSILIIVFFFIFIWMTMKKNYTVYTVYPVVFFVMAFISTIFVSFECQTGRMINPAFPIIFWLLTALAVGYRIMVNE